MSCKIDFSPKINQCPFKGSSAVLFLKIACLVTLFLLFKLILILVEASQVASFLEQS